jgi:hypothetical protein
MRVAVMSGSVNQGIVVGTNNTAEDISDYKVIDVIPHGYAASTLVYGQGLSNFAVNNSGDMKFQIAREITNNSGGNLTIYEVGMYACQLTYYFCILRDVIGAGLTINDEETKIIEYIFQVAN